jgi:hypothetical protein
MPDVTPDPKPTPRIIDPNAGAAKLRREGHCRACGRRAGRHARLSRGRPVKNAYEYVKLTRHHLVPRSMRGDDLDENLVPLCGDGTMGCHGILETHPSGWEYTAMRLRLRLHEDEISYIVQKESQAFLDRYYPRVDTPLDVR